MSKLQSPAKQIDVLIRKEFKALTGHDMPNIGDDVQYIIDTLEYEGKMEWYTFSMTDEGPTFDMTVRVTPTLCHHVWTNDIVFH